MAVDFYSTLEIMGGELSLIQNLCSEADVQNLIDGSHVSSLRDAYPHIENPTPAQVALLKALDSPKDIFLRDRMGRGKYVTLEPLYPDTV
jgi:hypothetical protein